MSEFLQQWLPTMIAMVLTGAFAGILAGLLGVGGGIVIVPVLFFVLQHFGVSAATAMLVATATSLLVIVPTSISSMRAHHKRGNVDWALLKRWSPFMCSCIARRRQYVIPRKSRAHRAAIAGSCGAGLDGRHYRFFFGDDGRWRWHHRCALA
jgi:hypothetical protein